MRRALLSLLALCLALALALRVNGEEAAADVREETVDAATGSDSKVPPLSEDEFASIMAKVSDRCVKQVQENPSDPSKVSDRCRAEVAGKIQRFLARKNRAASEDAKPKKDKKAKAPKPKKKKLTRAQREAAEALKKEEEYQQTVQTILGFVVALVAGLVGVVFVINRKLKAAGMYYPTDPAAKADGCCG